MKFCKPYISLNKECTVVKGTFTTDVGVSLPEWEVKYSQYISVQLMGFCAKIWVFSFSVNAVRLRQPATVRFGCHDAFLSYSKYSNFDFHLSAAWKIGRNCNFEEPIHAI